MCIARRIYVWHFTCIAKKNFDLGLCSVISLARCLERQQMEGVRDEIINWAYGRFDDECVGRWRAADLKGD